MQEFAELPFFLLFSLNLALYFPTLHSETVKPVVPGLTQQLTFSSTQTWLPHFLDLAKEREKKGSLISLAPPPANDSQTTKEELAMLLKMQNKRTPAIQEQILVEKDVNNISYGEIVVDDHEQLFTPIGQLVYAFLFESMGELFAQKKKFDRVRPSTLARNQGIQPVLRTLLETPYHPAYPSGHSFQGHGIALLIAQVAPDQAAAALCDASRLAVGREMAGVHYASDSQAGADLAKAYMEIWLNRPEIKTQVSAAKKWWTDNRKAFLAERAFRKRSIYVNLQPPCSLASTRSRILNQH